MNKTNTPVRYFRNVYSEQNIDAGALWQFDEENRVLVLVDEDQHVTIPAAEVTMLNFFEVDPPSR